MEDVACTDELLDLRDNLSVLVGRGVGGGWCGRGWGEGNGQFGQMIFCAEFFEHALDAFAGCLVCGGSRFGIFDRGGDNDPQAPRVVVEDENSVSDEEERFREPERVRGRVANGGFEESHHVIRQVAHRPAGEAWSRAGLEVGHLSELVVSEQIFEFAKRVGGFEGPGGVGGGDRDAVTSALEKDFGGGADEGVSSALRTAVCGF